MHAQKPQFPETALNTQVLTYLLFCEGEIFVTHALTSLDTKPATYILNVVMFIKKINFDNFASQ